MIMLRLITLLSFAIVQGQEQQRLEVSLDCNDPDVFQCADGQKCIPLKWKCDFSPDCLDGSDEPPDCPPVTCQSDQFTCLHSRRCIPLDWRCDNEPDCGSSPSGTMDVSDEDPVRCRGNVTCSGNQFLCRDGVTCLHLSAYCNHRIDCPDNSDEGHQCKQAPSCQKMSCSHKCAITWKGPKCYCPEGLVPDEDNPATCIDYDECEVDSEGDFCDQVCENLNGSYSCSCQEGYNLHDQRSCQATNVPLNEPATLLFANSIDIQHIQMDGQMDQKVKTSEALALDFLHRNRSVCWISHQSQTKESHLKCADISNLNSFWNMPKLDMYSLQTVNQIAVDWASNNWYFLDDTRELILLCAFKSKPQNPNFVCKSILSVHLSKPRGIALDPNEGLMFFTVWGANSAKLERAELDGEARQILVDTKIVYPYGLTVDFPLKRVYWVDTYLDYIEAVDYDGSNRKTLLRGSPVQNLYSVSVFENSLFLTSWHNNSILRVNKFHPEEHSSVREGLERPFAIQVFHRQRQPLTHSKGNQMHHVCMFLQPCDHICLPVKEEPFYKCICQAGFEIKEESSKKCQPAERPQFLLYGQQKPGVVRGLDLKAPKREVIIPMIDLVRPTAMDYHAEANHLYLADSERLQIQRQHISNGTKEVFLDSRLNTVMGLAVDWIGRNLYWTDEGLRTIFVADLNQPLKRASVISDGLLHPRSIVIDALKGLMYWSNWPEGPPLANLEGEEGGKIEMSWMDGSHRETFLSEDIIWPNGLSIDFEASRIYWCDSFLQRIESLSLAKTDRRVHLTHATSTQLVQPYGLAFHQKSIFWSEFEEGHVYKLDLETSNISLILQENPQSFALKVFDREGGAQPRSSHACDEPETCQDLCLVVPNGLHICKCRDGRILNEDGVTCQEIPDWKPPSHCRSNQFQCRRNPKCIDERYTCDGENDCSDGSDEDIETTCKHVSCHSTQFRCDKTKCIDAAYVCDGERDCVDGTDEKPQECDEKYCSSNTKFLCKKSRKCISKSWVCDGDHDCGSADFSDEDFAHCKDSLISQSCQPYEYSCDNNKRCIRMEYLCDGEHDCVDGTDELNCLQRCNSTGHFCQADLTCLNPQQICDGINQCSDGSDEENCAEKIPLLCRDDEFQCGDSSCIPVKFKCDGSADCLDESDENECKIECLPNETKCSSGKCILTEYICDGDLDCEDGSDEENCQKEESLLLQCQLPNWSCDNTTTCLDITKVCDGVVDCIDRSDEGLRCGENLCQTQDNECSDLCRNTPTGHQCYCPEEMHLNGNTCSETHPCTQWGTCSQLCKTISRHQHKCYCHANYYLQPDGFTCKSKDSTAAYAIYSSRNELRLINVRNFLMRPLLSSLRNTVALDFYYTRAQTFLFWTDVVDDKIYRGVLRQDTSITDITAIVENGLGTAEGLAVDWIGQNIYWVESKLDQIEVAKLDGRFRRTLINDGIQNPRAIALDPRVGRLFWTDWNEDVPRIESSDMSGQNRTVIFNVTSYKNGAWPNGITLDYIQFRIYWIDARADSIHTANYDGSNHREILRNTAYLSHPFAITLFESHVYWTDWRSTDVIRAGKFNGSEIRVLDQIFNQPCDIKIVHPTRQPIIEDANDAKLACSRSNGNCTHLCLLTFEGFICACPHLMELNKDGKTCVAKEKFFLVAKPNEIRGLDSRMKHNVIPPISLPKVSTPQALDFNAELKKIYWFDSSQKRIMSSFINGSSLDTVINKVIISEGEKYEAFAIDWITNNIYFCSSLTPMLDAMSAKTSNIFVTKHDFSYVHSVIEKNPRIIRGLVLAPTLGYMYWHDQDEDLESLVSAKMNGETPEQFHVFHNKPGISGLTYSSESHQLFWINQHLKTIQRWDFKSSNLQLLQSSGNAMTSLTLKSNQIYYATQGSIFQNIHLIANLSQPIYSLSYYNSEDQVSKNNACYNNNRCQHLCIPSGLNFRCACSLGYILENGTQCIEDQSDRLVYTTSYGLAALLTNDTTKKTLVRPLSNLDATAIETYPASQYIFWIDGRGINRMKMDGTDKKLILNDLLSPQKLSVDWVSERIYWTDDKNEVIESADFHGKFRYVLIAADGIEKPHAIVINPLDGIVFWSDIQETSPKIERAGLDGSNRMVIVQQDLKSPLGLTLDLAKQRLYWSDSQLSGLFSVDFNGGSRQNILESSQANKWLSKPTSIAYFDNHLYWLDTSFNGGSILRTPIEIPLPEILTDHLGRSTNLEQQDLKIYSSKIQEGTNPCSINNGGCEEICLFNGQFTSCACSYGRIDPENGRSCIEYEAFILYSKVSSLESIHISNASNMNPPYPKIESNIKNSIGLAYDYSAETIFYSDLQLGSISKVYFNGSGHEVLVPNVGSIEGLVYEHRQSYLYWTSLTSHDKSISRVNLTKLKIEKVIRLHEDDRPRGIDVDSCELKIYFTNWNLKNPSIQRAWVSGYGLESIITTKIRMPNAITVDAQERKMYWGDARLDKIELVYLDSMERIVLKKAGAPLQHPFDLAFYEQNLFYTDWVAHTVTRINRYTGEDMRVLRKNIPRPMSIIAVANQSQECEQNPCSVLNGGCEDICEVLEGKPTCSCKEGRYLMAGDKRCSYTNQHCLDENQFQCSQSLGQSPICVPYNLTCDGLEHCPDGSDEDVRYCAVRSCKKGFFGCGNNRCVLDSSVCNKVDDCGDFSDEEGCPCPDKTMFKCAKGPCISAKRKCDSKPDCEDASDEMDCPKMDCNLFSTNRQDPQKYYSKLVHCNTTTACILPEWICDGSNDCWDNSDEVHCQDDDQVLKPQLCPPETTFQCDNGKCISLGWLCDREDDCHDGTPSSDERNCTFSCRPDQFKCLSGDCIPSHWKCDGTPDCNDGSDESGSCNTHQCLNDLEFKCQNTGRCIPKAWLCDGVNDCGDDPPGLDEMQCQGQGHCLSDEFKCLNNKCISNHFYCDFDNDCGDNSDEPSSCDYNFCPRDYLRCRDSHGCAPYAKLCDNVLDCNDGSDENVTVCAELNHHKESALLKSKCQAKDQFGCTNGACVPLLALCNGQDECGDYSDEASCNVNECENPYTCAHICNDKPIGYECSCRPGFTIRSSDPSMCDDINECEEIHPCSQMCLNTPGGYKCLCHDGYLAVDDASHSCKANSTEEFMILFTSRYYIKLSNGLGITQTLVKNQSNAVAIDYDWKTDCIFWSDVTSRGSSLLKMCNMTTQPEPDPNVKHIATLQNPDGLAVDWVARNLYWCDKGSDTIEVSDLDGNYRKILLNQGLQEPRAIAVDPNYGLMFWSDWGEKPHIGRAAMDGSNVSIIIESDLGWPNALALDYVNGELYFGDAREDYIAVTDYQGKKIRMVLVRGLTPSARLQHIFALTVFEDYIYWSDWETSTIERCHKYSGKENKTLLSTIHRPMDLQVFHPLRQPQPVHNPCENNGGCEALCLLVPNKNGNGNGVEKVCQCPENFILQSDGLSCKSNCSASSFLCEKTLRCLPFWWKCDGQDDCGDGSDEPPSCPPFVCRPGQFQCDNAHCIFPMHICDQNDDCGDASDEQNCNDYSCYGKQFKCPGNESQSGFCIPDDKKCNGIPDCPGGQDEVGCPPRECPVNHFSCQNDNCIPNVWVCDGDNDCGDNTDEMDTCPERSCTDDQFKCPGGRCIPLNWKCDGDPDCENAEDEPEDCKDDSVKKCEESYFKCNNHRCIPGRWRCDHDNDCGDNSDELNCFNSYRNCSESERTCSNGMCVHESKFCDGKNDCKDNTDELFCHLQCSNDEFQCHSPQYCIYKRWKCDGDRDCSDGSDEKDCPLNSCAPGEFTCKTSSECINSQWVCDGESDCEDGSDENSDMCHGRACEPHRYRCDNNAQCILWSSVCDSVQDCSDNSDESDKACRSTNKARVCTDLHSFQCGNGRCIDSSSVCNGENDCGDESDELECKNQNSSGNNNPCYFGACSQICHVKMHSELDTNPVKVNSKRNVSSATCSCVQGYSLEAKKTCKAMGENATLLLANENILRMIYPYAYHKMVDLHPEIHRIQAQNLPKIESVDMFYEDGVPHAVWSVKEEKTIYYQKMDYQRSKRSAEPSTRILVDQVDLPRGLAVDFIDLNLYYINGLHKSVSVVKIKDSSLKAKKVIIKNGLLSEPQDLAVDPFSRRLFISDYGSNAKIFTSDLTGNGLYTLVESKLLWPSSLALDYPNLRLYWTDLKLRTIDSIDLEGQNRKLIRKFHPKEGKPYKLDVFENYVYFSTYQHNKILKINKFGKGNVSEIAEEITRISDITIMQVNKFQTIQEPFKSSLCSKTTLQCQPNSFCLMGKCICIDGYELSADDNICRKTEDKTVSKCEDLDCHRGVCKLRNDGQAYCDCIDPMYNGTYCDNYICAGYCLNGGMCFPIYDQTIQPLLLKCSCRNGFEGDRCQIPSDCNCAHNATCSKDPTTGTQSCICPTGFQGEKCEECASNEVCLNEGQCIADQHGNFRCNCAPGFHGPLCQYRLCDSFGPCQNGGTCIATQRGPQCQCPSDYKGPYCGTYVCDDYCLHGGSPTGTWTGEDYHCKCDCPPGTSGLHCEKDSCSSGLKCLNGGHCKVLDSREICNCTMAFTGLRCEVAIAKNPCDSEIKCQNGGICSAVQFKQQFHRKCICPLHWAGLECQRPNMCLNRCLNGGRCVSTIDGTVSCICPSHLTGSRCEYKRPSPFRPLNDDEKAVNSTVITVITSIFSLLAFLSVICAIVYFYRKTRLGMAFKHRRMAENLLSNNIEFSNQMYMPEEAVDDDHDDGHILLRETSNNFSNPVYENMYGNNEARNQESENQGLLQNNEEEEAQVDLIEIVNDDDEDDPESVDLLTEKHRGNISL